MFKKYTYYCHKRYRHWLYATDKDDNIYEYKTYPLTEFWQKATWKSTIGFAERQIGDTEEYEMVDKKELKKAGIPLIPRWRVREEPTYKYYISSEDNVIARWDPPEEGMRPYYVYRGGWWEHIHHYIPGYPIDCFNELHHSYILSEKDLAKHKARPMTDSNQICRLPKIGRVKFPLTEANNNIEKPYCVFTLDVEHAYQYVYKWHPELFDEYLEAFEIIRKFEHKKGRMQWGDPEIAHYAKADKTGKLQKAIDIIKEIHEATLAKEKSLN